MTDPMIPDVDDIIYDIDEIDVVYYTLVDDRVIPDSGVFQSLDFWKRDSWARADRKLFDQARPKLAEAIEDAFEAGVRQIREIVEDSEHLTKNDLIAQDPKLRRLSEKTLQQVTRAIAKRLLADIDEHWRAHENDRAEEEKRTTS